MQILVEPFQNLGDRIDVQHLGLPPEPFGELFNFAKVLRIAHSSALASPQRIMDVVRASQIGFCEVVRLPDLRPLTEVAREVIVKLVARGETYQRQTDQADAPEQRFSAPDGEIGAPIQRHLSHYGGRSGAYWEDSQ